MAEDSHTVALGGELAKPLHLQHLERNLDVEPFLSYVEHIFNTPIRYLRVKDIGIVMMSVTLLHPGIWQFSVTFKIIVSSGY
jgi:hypothetical protein